MTWFAFKLAMMMALCAFLLLYDRWISAVATRCMCFIIIISDNLVPYNKAPCMLVLKY